MLGLQTRLRPNSDEVAAKVMEGEAIMINLANGIYYSMDGVGGLMWEMVEGGHSVEEIVGRVLARYQVSTEQARADVERLTKELVQEQLVLVTDEASSNGKEAPPGLESKMTYESPTLNIYRDMGDLLALDPPMPEFANTPWQTPADEPPHPTKA